MKTAESENSQHFERWWENTVLDKLPDQSVVVIDNAKYHLRQTKDSKKPKTGLRKVKIQEWLAEREISFDPKDTIPILLMKSKSVFLLKKSAGGYYGKDCARTRKDIQTLRLPVGHSELNPVELIWVQVNRKWQERTLFSKLKMYRPLCAKR